MGKLRLRRGTSIKGTFIQIDKRHLLQADIFNRYCFWVGEVQNAATCSSQTWGWGQSCSSTAPWTRSLCAEHKLHVRVCGWGWGCWLRKGGLWTCPRSIIESCSVLGSLTSRSIGSLLCTGGLPRRWQDRGKGCSEPTWKMDWLQT